MFELNLSGEMVPAFSTNRARQIKRKQIAALLYRPQRYVHKPNDPGNYARKRRKTSPTVGGVASCTVKLKGLSFDAALQRTNKQFAGALAKLATVSHCELDAAAISFVGEAIQTPTPH
jgi:hypothetical protein